MLLTEEERAQLEELAVAAGLTASDILRQYIRKAYEERFSKTAKKR